MNGIIAILTDFGNRDAYTAAMKGVILSLNRKATIIDICHQIPSYSIVSASYLIYTVWDYYPEGTTFLSVVDPGVGSSRGILIAIDSIHSKTLVTPDNGTVSMLVRMKKVDSFYKPSDDAINRIKKLIPNTSSTFHGRDIFSPLAALISLEKTDSLIGGNIKPHLLNDVNPKISSTKSTKIIEGKILHIDSFGNCISSIHQKDIPTPDILTKRLSLDIQVGKTKLKKLSAYFSQVSRGEPLAYIGSSGFIEVAINQGNAASSLKIRIGDKIIVKEGTSEN